MRDLSQAIEEEDSPANGTLVVASGQQLELFRHEEIVRPDYNIGKYATILFASPHERSLTEQRTYTWDIQIGAETATAGISIHPLKDQKVPTTTTFKVLMAIIQLWRLQGSNPDGAVYFSDRQLAEVAGWPYSGIIAKRIREHIRILKGTTIDWVFAFRNVERLERKVQQMSLVNEATYIERGETLRSERFRANHIVELNGTLVKNMLDNVVRPINYAALRQISSDASTRLYIMLDLFLASKRKWERRSAALLRQDLKYEGKRYENRGERKRTLRRLIGDLDGKELANGVLKLELAETADGTDWKLVARKEMRIKKQRPKVPVILNVEDAELLADDLLAQFQGLSKAGPPNRDFMIFLCQRYPEPVLHDALARAKADYRDTVRKSMGAVFRYELEGLVRGRGDLTWYKATRPMAHQDKSTL
ncbi:MAG: hypothetical protein AAGI03_02300 [Pseudomonadota bacterium]